MSDRPYKPYLFGVFEKPFAHQVAAWRLRLGELRPTQAWTDVEPAFHDRGFMVAGAMKAELLADLARAVGQAIEGGGTLERFRKDFRKIVAEHGWHGWTGEGTVKGEGWRTRVIYRTNMATTYAAGRRAQLIEGNFRWWVYRHGASREPRLVHLGWDGLALPPEHPFWATHSPPNGWGCSCYVLGARTEAGIRRQGGDPAKTLPPGWDKRDPRTGAPPGIDRGWAHAPGASVAETVSLGARALGRLPSRLAADFAASDVRLRDAIPEASDGATDLAALAELEPFSSVYPLAQLRRDAERVDATGLDLAERLAVRAYTSPGIYQPLAAHLREETFDAPAAFGDLSRVLSRALGRLPAFRGTVFRGVEASPQLLARFEALRPQDVVRFRAFTSTSESRASAIAGDVLFEIESRSGRSIRNLSVMPHELEVLFDKGTLFEVVAIGHDEGWGYPVRKIVLREIGDAGGRAVALMQENVG